MTSIDETTAQSLLAYGWDTDSVWTERMEFSTSIASSDDGPHIVLRFDDGGNTAGIARMTFDEVQSLRDLLRQAAIELWTEEYKAGDR